MKIEKEILDDHQIQLNVEIEPDPLEAAKRRAARKIAKKVKIPGFRPGKAPYQVVLRHVGEDAIVEDALDILIEEIYPKVIDEADILPYGPGNLEKIESLDPPNFQFVIPLAPEVELGDYKALDITYEIPEVEKEAIESQIDELRQQQAVTETSEAPAKEGDRVFYQVRADRVEISDDEELNLIPERFNSAIIEKEGEEQNLWPYLGFSRNLIGMSLDDEKDVIYTYPEDHEDEALQGVEAVFHIVITNVQTVSLPEVDDEFAKSASEFDTSDELRNSIEQNLIQQNEQEYDSDYNDQVISALVNQSKVKYPPQMLENEKKEMVSNLEYRLSQQGITRELYLQIRGISEEEFDEEMGPLAENRIKNGLVLAEVAKVENLEVDQEQIAAETGRTVDIITQGMTPKDAKDFRKSSNLWNIMNSIMAEQMTQQSMTYLRAIAKGDPLPDKDGDDGKIEGSITGESDEDSEAVMEEVVEDPVMISNGEESEIDSDDEVSSPNTEITTAEEELDTNIDNDDPEVE